ncbi:MAG: hypothetical protein N2561_00845 [Bacteroidetes bacterium]|nr:hypothetical protein [Rhodothermia bacterium]MCS7155825.1 hypothetical protein [Bacteroidota bacterium]MCX7906074.1 hypothetical protein [Bacteroidota bacterium]MDW8138202.1 hypothetical protein [Bacteroidota bacterium]MDW8285886.1 hypothetical protein [Bacteroidota bacterium]
MGASQQAPQVYVDCPGGHCDLDYIQTQVAFVHYVRDPAQAEVYVLVTTQPTGAGGVAYTLTFQGRRRFAGLLDTLRFALPPQSAADTERRKLAQMLRLGLTRYAARTPIADQLRLVHESPSDATNPAPPRDRWKNWVFSLSANGFFSGEQSQRYANYYGALSARHITPDWKFTLTVAYNHGWSLFKLGGRDLRTTNWSQSVNALLVRSLGSHGSAGAFAGLARSTFNNLAWSVDFKPAFEYNLFPYAEATRRQFRILYRVGPSWSRYREETIFGKTAEGLWAQHLTLALEFREPWGSASASVEGLNYFHDWGKRRLTFWGSVNLRLLKGLGLDLSGRLSWIQDQLSLPRRGATEEEVLLRQRQLATHYHYWINLGLTYTFGAIYTAVVNPRFGSTSGRGVQIILQ